jgi:hypothetical protein
MQEILSSNQTHSGDEMRMNTNKKFLISSSIIVAVLIVLGSFNNIVGYQTAQASNQRMITTEINEKDLLFQTIVDMANNKEMQRVILGSQFTGKRLFDSGMRFSTFTPPVLTEKFLKRIYTMGVILFRTLSKSKIHSIIEKYPVSNQGVQKRINAVIEKDVTLKGEMNQLSSLSCNCRNENTTDYWPFPVICTLLYPLYVFLDTITNGGHFYYDRYFLLALFRIVMNFGHNSQCWWYPLPF